MRILAESCVFGRITQPATDLDSFEQPRGCPINGCIYICVYNYIAWIMLESIGSKYFEYVDASMLINLGWNLRFMAYMAFISLLRFIQIR